MSKPSWNDAPQWANWLAMDSDEGWYWYEDEPLIGKFDMWCAQGRCEPVCDNISYSAADTLEKRP